MKKRIVVLMIALATVPAFAQTEADFEVGLTEDGEGVVIKKYTGKVLQVRIPAAIQGMPVREIGNKAFLVNRITGVVIPASVTVIGSEAFGGCKALSAITIPGSVTSIGDGAFNRSGLVSFIWPASIPVIPRDAFYGCKNLKTITIPEGVTEILYDAFHDCTALTEIRLPSTIRKIGTNAFDNCSSLVSVVIPDSVETIYYVGQYIPFSQTAFFRCPKLNLSSQAALRKRGYTGEF